MESVRKRIVAEILSESKNGADMEAACLRDMFANANVPDKELTYRHLKSFVLYKFMLSQDTAEDGIAELSEMSIARSLKLDRKIVAELDTAMPCSSATSAQAKKILLLYAVQKEIFPGADPEKLVLLKTVREMAEYVVNGDVPTDNFIDL